MDRGNDPPANPADAPDEVLLRRFADGDHSALEELARRYERALLGLTRGLLGGDAATDAACDAVQEAWVKVIRYARSFRGDSSFKTWMYRIVINQCHNIRAKRQPRLRLHNGVSAELAPDAAAPETPITDDDRAILRRELAGLSPDRRLVLLLCYHDGLTHEQAAEVLEIPLGTLKSRLHAALTDLRRRLPSEVRT